MEKEILQREFEYRTARSGGKGGQHVNKVETKVEARLNLAGSKAFSEEEKGRLLRKLGHEIAADGSISRTDQSTRSQTANKQKAEIKLIHLIEEALKQQKKRKKTVISVATKEKRRAAKEQRSAKKQGRQRLKTTDYAR